MFVLIKVKHCLADCPDGAQKIEGKCIYALNDWARGYGEASHACKVRGGKVFEPNGLKINDLVRTYVTLNMGSHFHYWIGIDSRLKADE